MAGTSSTLKFSKGLIFVLSIIFNLLFAVTTFSNQSESQNIKNKVSIQGNVISKETGLPLEGANVKLNNNHATETDSIGYFQFLLPYSEKCNLEVSSVGYTTIKVSKKINANDSVVVLSIVMQVNPVESDDIIVSGKYNRDPLRTTINSKTIMPDKITLDTASTARSLAISPAAAPPIPSATMQSWYSKGL